MGQGGTRMKILVAEDDATTRAVLASQLEMMGQEAALVVDGLEALDMLLRDDAPQLAILDWMMPGLDGIEVCRRVKQQITERYVYVMMLTAKDRHEDLLQGFEAGVDDFLRKPVHPAELRCRIAAGQKIVSFDQKLRNQNKQLLKVMGQQEQTITELKEAMEHIRTLQGLLPVCSLCKKVRDDKGYWNQIETYLSEHADIRVTHGLCPDCAQKLYPEYYRPEWGQRSAKNKDAENSDAGDSSNG